MVKVNCAALPSNLIESELFGRDKGAYTRVASANNSVPDPTTMLHFSAGLAGLVAVRRKKTV